MSSEPDSATADADEVERHPCPRCRVILTVYEMKRLGRDSAELTALADHLTAHGIALEMLAGPPGTGRILFAFSPRWPRSNARTSARLPSKGSTPLSARETTADDPR